MARSIHPDDVFDAITDYYLGQWQNEGLEYPFTHEDEHYINDFAKKLAKRINER